MALEPGSKLGPYEVVGLLGSGGMGEVYRARDPRLGREVAIKVLPEQVADPKRLRRFEQEARAAGALDHPNVLAVHDVGTHDGVPYVVSELLEGQTLRVRLEGGALPVRKALDYALQIARGLAAAHEKGIVHRDLKPENVFVTEEGRVKILDFGLAKLTRPGPLGGEDDERSTMNATESGTVLGTVGYMSPEQVRGDAADHRSDIFSFGAVLYEMLSGRRAFRRDTAAETMNAILKEDPPELTGTESQIPSGLVKIARRCLEKRAGDRFHSAHDLALALETISSEASRSATEEGGGSDVALVVEVAKRHRVALLTTLAVVLLAAGGLYWAYTRSPDPPRGDAITSVAVLPFENVGGDPDSEYLSDGVAETLINTLSRLANLKVLARSTTFRFRGDDVDPQQVGRDLEVGAVVTGRVSLRGDTLVIGAELVDVAEGTQLWGERYNAQRGDIFAVEEKIASEISRGLRLKLAPRDEALLTRRHTADPEAYRLYLLSRHASQDRFNPERLKRAVGYAQRATEKDPSYAPAYVALAESYNWLGSMGLLSYREAYSKSKSAATRALEIDETLPEGHVVHAEAIVVLDRDWAGARRGLERALELNPNSANAQEGYGFHLLLVGRSHEGIAHVKRAVDLDALSPQRHSSLAWAYYVNRQFDETLHQARVAVELAPGTDLGWLVAVALVEQGMYEKAIAEFRESAKGVAPALTLGHLGNAYARAGKAREARQCLRELEERSKEDGTGTYEVALIHAGLGEKDQAFEWLGRAYEEHDQGLIFLRVDPSLDPLRSDPRFQDLLRRMNFPS